MAIGGGGFIGILEKNMETTIVYGFIIRGNELIRSIAQLYLVTVFREVRSIQKPLHILRIFKGNPNSVKPLSTQV